MARNTLRTASGVLRASGFDNMFSWETIRKGSIIAVLD